MQFAWQHCQFVQGHTPLHLAIANNLYPDTIDLLLQHASAAVNIRDNMVGHSSQDHPWSVVQMLFWVYQMMLALQTMLHCHSF